MAVSLTSCSTSTGALPWPLSWSLVVFSLVHDLVLVLVHDLVLVLVHDLVLVFVLAFTM